MQVWGDISHTTKQEQKETVPDEGSTEKKGCGEIIPQRMYKRGGQSTMNVGRDGCPTMKGNKRTGSIPNGLPSAENDPTKIKKRLLRYRMIRKALGVTYPTKGGSGIE